MSLGFMPSWWVWFVAAGLFTLFIYWDYSSRSNSRRSIRITLLSITMICLLGVIVEPQFEREAPNVNVLVSNSPNAIPDQDNRLGRSYILARNFEELQTIQSNSNIQDLEIVEGALQNWEIAQLSIPFQFIESDSAIEGPIDYSVSEAVVNNQFEISITVLANDTMTLSISGPGINTQKRTVVSGVSSSKFEISSNVSGHLQYQLNGVRNRDTLFSEVVPVHIMEKLSTQVLLLAQTPSFEHRFLKNYLTQSGFNLTERLQVSEGLYYESSTQAGQNSDTRARSGRTLTDQILANYKLVILDSYSYQNLTAQERNSILNRLKTDELGLIWTDNSVSNNLVKTENTSSEPLQFDGGSTTIQVEKKGNKLMSADAKITVQDQVIGETLNYGLGKITYPIVTNTYTISLKGEQTLYSQIWERLIQSVVGKSYIAQKINSSRYPRVGSKMVIDSKLRELSDVESEPVYIDSTRVTTNENWYQLGRGQIEFWPSRKGWIEFMNQKFFVFDSTAWIAQKQWSERTQASKYAEISQSKSTELSGSTEPRKVKIPIDKWVFFVGFIVSLAILWIEQRI